MEETFNIKAMVTILLKGKRLITSCILIAVLIAAVISFFVIDPVYESKVTISVHNGPVTGSAPSETDGYFNEVITPAAYIERVKSAQVIDQAIKKSGLTNYNVSFVQKNLSAENTANTNLVIMRLKAKSPQEAKTLLESIIVTMKESLLTEVQARIQEDIKYYGTQAGVEKKNLELLLKQYRQQAQALNLPKSLLLDTVISYNNQYILTLDQERLSTVADISEEELILLNEVSSEVKTSANIYRDYSNKERQLKAFSEIFRVDNKVLTISAPTENQAPVSLPPALNILIALFVGLLVGTGLVFLRYYWNHTK